MKRLISLAMSILLLALAACGVVRTPVEPTSAPEPEFARHELAEGVDYTFSELHLGPGQGFHESGLVVDTAARADFVCFELDANGRLVPLDAQLFSQDFTLGESSYHVEFEWVEHNGNVLTSLYASNPGDFTVFYNGLLNAPAERFVIGLGGRDTGYYPVLADLRTGEMSDVFASTDIASLEDINNCVMMPDGSGAFISRLGGENWLYCDLVNGEVTELDAIPNSMWCAALDGWAMFSGYYTDETAPDKHFRRVVAFRPGDLSAETVYEGPDSCNSDEPGIYIDADRAGRRAVCTQEDGVYALDLTGGGRSLLPGLEPGEVLGVEYDDTGAKALVALGFGSELRRIAVVDFVSGAVNVLVSPEGAAYSRLQWVDGERFALIGAETTLIFSFGPAQYALLDGGQGAHITSEGGGADVEGLMTRNGEVCALGPDGFEPLERHSFSAEVVHAGEAQSVEFDWYALGGAAYIPGMDTPQTFTRAGMPYAVAYVRDDGGTYPVVADLVSNRLIDVLAGTSVETMPGHRSMTLSPDGSGALVRRSDLNGGNEEWFYVRLGSGQMSRFSDEVPIDGAYSLAAVFNDCVVVRTLYLDGEARGEVRVVPTDNYSAELGASALGEFELARATGDGAYCEGDVRRHMLLASGGESIVIDLIGGDQARLPDTGRGAPDELVYSPDGGKAALVWADDAGAITALAAADFTARTLTEFVPPEGISGAYVSWISSSAFTVSAVNASDMYVYGLGSDAPSTDPADYGLTVQELPDFTALSLPALGAYYLNSDGAMSEGAICELVERFIAAPDEALDYLLSLGDQAAPHFPEVSAAGQIARSAARWSLNMGVEQAEGFPAALDAMAAAGSGEAASELISAMREVLG